MQSESAPRVFYIKDGTLSCFKDELLDGQPCETIESRRVSHVVPQNPLLRVVFVSLRWLVSDNSRVAQWTRHWPVTWMVLLEGQCHRGFRDRAKAIAFEKRHIHAHHSHLFYGRELSANLDSCAPTDTTHAQGVCEQCQQPD
ncbi:MAG: hypothetical protein C9356_15125 [Oleiphilus sp.]|nr:MAG: hypothetical protein C9356_15125 [Oleiphilus sp.]